jgi:RNA polymerase sigma-70 factor (ECF subfamily)
MKNSWTGGEAAYALESEVENLALSVHRCESGAFEQLIERFEAPLFSYAHGILQNSLDAQEVVQDALVRAHRALSRQYDESKCASLALRPWLFRAVRNLCLNKRRSKSRKLERPLEEFDDGRIGACREKPRRLGRCSGHYEGCDAAGRCARFRNECRYPG